MRRWARWLVVGSFAGLAVTAAGRAAAQADAARLRLEDAVRLAVTRNERARISDLNVVVAEAAVERARSAFLPIIGATANDTIHPAIGTAQPSHVGTAALAVTQPILNVSAFPLYAQARALERAQRAQNTDDKRLLAYNAAASFFGVLSAQAILDAAQRQVDNARSNLAYAQARVEAQLTTSNDVTRAQIDMASSEREAAADAGSVDNAVLQLAFLLNAPVRPPLVPPEPTLKAAQVAPGGPDSLVRFAMDHRPDILVDQHLAAAAHHFADEPLLRIIPTLGITGTASGTTNTPISTHEWYDESVSATLTFPVFDSGLRYADKHSRDAQAEIADLTLKELVRNVDTQVRSAAALLASAQNAFRVAYDAMTASRQNVEETDILYRQGLARAIELVDANDARFTAEVGYAGAQYAMAQAYLNLRQALGLDVLETELK